VHDRPTYTSGTLPYSADDGPTSGQALRYSYDSETVLTIAIKTPDTLTPTTQDDWTWTDHELDGYEALDALISHGSLSAPEFHPTQSKTGSDYHELIVPVELDHAEQPAEVEHVLALDGGLRKDMTAVVMNRECSHMAEGREKPRATVLEVVYS
jgi:putative transposase